MKSIRKLLYGKSITIVSGLPRSGTSMVMKMLEAGGMVAISDEARLADEDNPLGYYELERIKDLGKDKDTGWLKDLRGKAVKIISLLLKELPRNNNYAVIFIERDLQEVVASQNKMLERRNEPFDPHENEKMIEDFKAHLKEIMNILKSESQFDVMYLNHRNVLDNPAEQAHMINMFLGGHLKEDKMASAVNPKLYRSRQN